MAKDYKSQIALLDKACSAMYEYQIKGADAESTDLLRRLNDLRRRIQKEAGWHVVSHIVNGCANTSLFYGPLDHCREYVSIWREGHPDAGNDLIITPL